MDPALPREAGADNKQAAMEVPNIGDNHPAA